MPLIIPSMYHQCITCYTPYFLNSEQNPTLPKHLVISPSYSSNHSIREAISRMKQAPNDKKRNLAKAQKQMKCWGDKARRAKEWMVGDRVFLSMRNLQMFALHLPPELKRRWVGPFTITKVVSPIAFWLGLPTGWEIHPTFQASNVKAYIWHPDFEWEVEPPL